MSSHAVLMDGRSGLAAQARERLWGVFSDLGWPSGVPDSTISVRNAYDPALAALGLGDVAIAIVDHARPRGPWLWSYLIWADFDPIRVDPRFIKIFEESKPPGAPDIPR